MDVRNDMKTLYIFSLVEIKHENHSWPIPHGFRWKQIRLLSIDFVRNISNGNFVCRNALRGAQFNKYNNKFCKQSVIQEVETGTHLALDSRLVTLRVSEINFMKKSKKFQNIPRVMSFVNS